MRSASTLIDSRDPAQPQNIPTVPGLDKERLELETDKKGNKLKTSLDNQIRERLGPESKL